MSIVLTPVLPALIVSVPLATLAFSKFRALVSLIATLPAPLLVIVASVTGMGPNYTGNYVLDEVLRRLDGQKKELNAEMLNTTDADKAMELHNQIEAIATELTEAEDKWCQLSEELGDF